MKARAVSLLQALIGTDTSNPPGNEWPAVELLAKCAEEFGFTVRTFPTAANRGNIAISYNGTFDRPVILLSHLDVVPATSEQWTHPPFSGACVDGEIWGRGAIDTKQLTVMHFIAMVLAREAGVLFERDIVLIATSDEESGSTHGLLAMLETPESSWFDDSVVLTEGGGFPIIINQMPVYLIQTGQKSLAQVRITIDDSPHASPFFPNLDSGVRAAKVVRMLDEFCTSASEEVPQTTRELIAALGLIHHLGLSRTESTGEWYNRLQPFLTPSIDSFLGTMMRSTIVPTIWNGGTRNKVKGGVFELTADARLLPSMEKAELEGLLESIQVSTDADCQILSFEKGFESPRDPALFGAISEAISGGLRTPSHVVPFLSAGGSDARHLTSRCSAMYGYSPVLSDLTFDRAVTMVHGVDERISVESLWFGCQVMFDTLRRFSSK